MMSSETLTIAILGLIVIGLWFTLLPFPIFVIVAAISAAYVYGISRIVEKLTR